MEAAGSAVIVAVCVNAAVDVTYTVPQLRPGRTHRVEQVRSRAGGKGINVARVLHQLGQDVVVCGFVGGVTGAAIVADLQASGIAQRLTPVAGQSRRSVAVVANEEATVFNEPGPPVDDAEWARLVADVGEASTGAGVVVLSGSLVPGAPAGGYAELTALARRQGALVVLDAAGAALGEALVAQPDVVKPNAEEVATLLGRPVRDRDDAREAGRLLLRRGAQAAVVSRGASGLVSVRDGEALQVRLPRAVGAIGGNPTGAGDALAAAIARGLATGATWREALCDGVAISAAAVTEPVAGTFAEPVAAELRPLVQLEEI